MGFRECDDRFARSMAAVSRDREGFGNFVKDFVKAQRQREKRIKANSEELLEKYGIKYCPFHAPVLAKDVRPNSVILNVGEEDYTFHDVDCSHGRFCHIPISFDKGLIEKLSESLIGEIVLEDRKIGCVSCGETEGKVYLAGFRSGIDSKTALKREQEFSNDSLVYLFEKSCGRNYVTIGSGDAPGLIGGRYRNFTKSHLVKL